MSNAASTVKLLCLDVDGVLTDGVVSIDDRGVETKRYHVRDGCGIGLWKKLGYEAAIISGRAGMSIRHRAEELGIAHVVLGCSDKAAALERLAGELGMELSDVAAMGDDLPDLPMLRRAGYAIAVGDACREVRDAAAFVTVRPGGAGAVREAIEHLLKVRNQWTDAIAHYGHG